MNPEEVCLICLIMDVRMYPRDGVFKVYIENLFGDILFQSPRMPTAVCYECANMLQKFHKFREKFSAAQSILYELEQTKEQVTKEDIQKIDRKALKLHSNLSIEFIPDIDSFNIYPSDVELEVDNKLDVDIKSEFKIGSIINNIINHATSGKQMYEDDKICVNHTDTGKTSYENEINCLNQATSGKKLYEDDKNSVDNYIDNSDFDDDDVPLKNLRDSELIAIKQETQIVSQDVIEPQPVLKRASVKKVKNTKSKAKKTTSKTETKKKNKRKKNKDADDITQVSGFIRDPSKINELVKDFEIIKFTTLDEQIAEMEKRKESANYKLSQYKCEHCYRGFLHQVTLKNHLVYHEPKQGYTECVVCHMHIRPRSKFRQHVLRHSTKFNCRTCDFFCYESNQAARHTQWHKGVEYKCEFCPATFKRLTSQQTHIRTQHRTTHVCATCGYSFVSDRGLKMHQAKTHRDTYKYRKKALPPLTVPEHEKSSRLYCAECDLKLADDDAWTRHMATSAKHRQTGCVCRNCGQQFSSSEQRSRHGCPSVRRRPRFYMRRYKTVHSDVNYPRSCEICTVELHSRQQHYKHYQKEHTDVPYPHATHNYICELCGKGFGILQVLKQHRLKHLSLKTFSCTLCPKAFYNNTQLKLHLQSHSTNRPHPCPLCGKCFKTNIALYAHVKRHEGVRRFSCQYCGKAFTTAPNMRQHIKHVHMNVADKPQPQPE